MAAGLGSALQAPFAAAVVVPTVLRPSLLQAVRSVFAQDLPGRIQILIGVDVAEGDPAILEVLRAECPSRMHLTIVDPGYSTSVRHGGLHANGFSGALRTILSYLANSRHVAYLDDDNWFAPDHLSSLRQACGDWAYSHRWFVIDDTPLCVDDWESTGPGSGVYAEQYGGFVDPSSLMIDKIACLNVLPLWSMSPFADGSGEDRLVFEALRSQYRGAATGNASSYYRIHPRDTMHLERLRVFRERGIVLPGDRAAGIVPLAQALEAIGLEATPVPPDIAAAPSTEIQDVLLHDILSQLRPREIVVLGDQVAVSDLVALAAAEALAPVIVLAAADVAAVPAAAPVTVLDNKVDDPWGWLEATRIAVDLVRMGQVAVPIDRALAAAWHVTRTGGLILGEDIPATDAALQDAARRFGATIHDAAIGNRGRWMIQKDR